jgi:hypothetical protein
MSRDVLDERSITKFCSGIPRNDDGDDDHDPDVRRRHDRGNGGARAKEHARRGFRRGLARLLLHSDALVSRRGAPFQQYQNAICGSGECVIGFEAPPIGKRLELHDSSCYLRMRGANELRGMWLYLSAGEFLVALAPEATIREGESDQTVYAANHSIFAYARAGVQFLALVQWTRGVAEQFACHISGEMLDEPG